MIQTDRCVDNFFLDKEDIEKAVRVSPKNNLGEIYSLFFCLSLEYLIEEGKIKSYYQTIQNGKDDCDGIDFWITSLQEERIPISITGQRRNVKERAVLHPGVPVIPIRKGHGKEIRSIIALKIVTMRHVEDYINSHK